MYFHGLHFKALCDKNRYLTRSVKGSFIYFITIQENTHDRKDRHREG